MVFCWLLAAALVVALALAVVVVSLALVVVVALALVAVVVLALGVSLALDGDLPLASLADFVLGLLLVVTVATFPFEPLMTAFAICFLVF